MSDTSSMQIDRRTAIKWVLVTAAALRMPGGAFDAHAAAADAGYGKDPDLMKVYEPGKLWPLTFNSEQRALATALCDLIIPADEHSPSASSVGVVAFIDEWISAPYPEHRRDRETVLTGMQWLDAHAMKVHGKRFVDLGGRQHSALLDSLSAKDAREGELAVGAAFFSRFRALTAGGFYTTPLGMKDLRYVGNEPLVSFDGPPPEVLKQLGLA